MADLNYDDVRKILAILDASTLDEVHIEIGNFKLDVRRRGASAPLPAAQAKPPPAPAKAPPSVVLAPGQFALTAPMLGTLYRAPSPDAPPFIQVGGVVSADDTLCIIEVMKLMNTIKAEKPGRVAAIVAENGTLVEFGQTLIVFDPL
ncbi:MAG TPA: acetyl-CoA carboxylase biotin carboxyl carrier protein [Candidatus Baltobacteraceae bacterium]|jgi:acetyl-CoA carboxylase biotin carboxyl carrier protein